MSKYNVGLQVVWRGLILVLGANGDGTIEVQDMITEILVLMKISDLKPADGSGRQDDINALRPRSSPLPVLKDRGDLNSTPTFGSIIPLKHADLSLTSISRSSVITNKNTLSHILDYSSKDKVLDLTGPTLHQLSITIPQSSPNFFSLEIYIVSSDISGMPSSATVPVLISVHARDTDVLPVQLVNSTSITRRGEWICLTPSSCFQSHLTNPPREIRLDIHNSVRIAGVRLVDTSPTCAYRPLQIGDRVCLSITGCSTIEKKRNLRIRGGRRGGREERGKDMMSSNHSPLEDAFLRSIGVIIAIDDQYAESQGQLQARRVIVMWEQDNNQQQQIVQYGIYLCTDLCRAPLCTNFSIGAIVTLNPCMSYLTQILDGKCLRTPKDFICGMVCSIGGSDDSLISQNRSQLKSRSHSKSSTDPSSPSFQQNIEIRSFAPMTLHLASSTPPTTIATQPSPLWIENEDPSYFHSFYPAYVLMPCSRPLCILPADIDLLISILVDAFPSPPRVNMDYLVRNFKSEVRVWVYLGFFYKILLSIYLSSNCLHLSLYLFSNCFYLPPSLSISGVVKITQCLWP
jgi:hypothetical protein